VCNEIILDTRELEAPEPISVVLNNLSNLNKTTSIHMIHRIEPLMLYTHLTSNNLQYKVVHKDEDVHIYIWTDSYHNKTKLEELN
jgi:hypothetical protein